MLNSDNEKIVVIDYEYGGWFPFAWDIANYINECMLDNIDMKVYESNLPKEGERQNLYRFFLEHYFKNYLPEVNRKDFPDFMSYFQGNR